MVFGKKDKSRQRFYLLPGQGGKAYHHKQRRILLWTVAVALFFGLAMAAVMWWFSHQKPL